MPASRAIGASARIRRLVEPSEPANVAIQLAHAVAGEAANTELAVTEVNTVFASAARHVFLKQFRDAQMPDVACYQEVVEADVEMTEETGGVSPCLWDVKIHTLTSHPIVDELGIPAQITTPAFELVTDMTISPAVLVIP